MDKEEPNFNTWGEISDSELVLEAAKREENTKKKTKKNVASRSWRRTTSQGIKNKCYCTKKKKKKKKSTTSFHGLHSYRL